MPGEVLTYNAYYNWGFIWLNAGEVEFNVTAKQYEGREVYHIYAFGTTYKSYDWIFKVRERYQSYIDPHTQMPLWYERDVVEGSYTAFEDYKFDYEDSVIHTYVQKRKNCCCYPGNMLLSVGNRERAQSGGCSCYWRCGGCAVLSEHS